MGIFLPTGQVANSSVSNYPLGGILAVDRPPTEPSGGVDQLREFDPSTETVGIQIKVDRCFGTKITVNVPRRTVTTPRMI